MFEIDTTFLKSPIGTIEVKSSAKGIVSLFFVDDKESNAAIPTENAIFSQLEEYFSGDRKKFDLELDLQGTEFQKSVWMELLNIPYGETRSYIHIAKKLGDPKKLRAVGNANGKNPVSIIVPCHRVIGTDGKLVGYGGGLWRKKWLLEHEQKFKQLSLF
ncbi:MAG: cysteine methyltransferase [Deltaproteobacteria bacterium]|nr:MAG: cysteine methyltransferase [Deltaproteobacteria bacterium]